MFSTLLLTSNPLCDRSVLLTSIYIDDSSGAIVDKDLKLDDTAS